MGRGSQAVQKSVTAASLPSLGSVQGPERLTVPQLFVQTIRFMLNTWCPSESLEFWYAGQKVPHDQLPVEQLAPSH